MIIHTSHCNYSYDNNANHSYKKICNYRYMERFNEKIKRIRKEKDISQQYIADKLGVSRVAVSKWENGQTGNMKFPNLIGICKLFKMNINDLLCGEYPELAKPDAPPNQINDTKSDYMSDAEKILLQGFRLANEESKGIMLMIAEKAIAEKEQASKRKA